MVDLLMDSLAVQVSLFHSLVLGSIAPISPVPERRDFTPRHLSPVILRAGKIEALCFSGDLARKLPSMFSN